MVETSLVIVVISGKAADWCSALLQQVNHLIDALDDAVKLTASDDGTDAQ